MRSARMAGSVLLLFLLFASCTALEPGSPFNCISAKDYALDKSLLGWLKLTEPECAQTCVDSNYGWSGYHYDNGRCYPLITGLNWHENSSGKVRQLCIYKQNQNCSATKFPWSFGRSRYVYVTRKRDWKGAANHCEGLGAKLLQLSTPSEQNFIANKLRRYRRIGRMYMYTIIGLLKLPMFRHHKNKGWIWHRSADPLHSSIVWYPGNPSNFANKQMVGTLYPNGKMDDGNHWHANYFICECFVI